MITIACPECKQPIDLASELKIGQQNTCQSCNTDFVITWLYPVCLDYLETKEQISTYHNIKPE